MEKKFRAYMRARGLKLGGLMLSDALAAMSDFWNTESELELHPVDGDCLVAYEDVIDHGRGTRLELGFIRILRLPEMAGEASGAAIRLRLRLCYKWDIDVIRDVLPRGTWSIACWAHADLEAFQQSVREKAAFAAMYSKTPSEVNMTLEEARCPSTDFRPTPESRQMWWGVGNVR
jgi:hypothetical protein